ncbi:MAG: WD40 repeat domain-containing serine/threonine protein kinase [bacterium]|nr:WD40 repeat domain-containing serine/threonine protein kinase [bacterium]
MAEIIASTYEVIKRIGDGGGGIVYLAKHLRLNKKVVLKAYKRTFSTDPEMLRREVDVLKELSYPNIPGVYDFFADGAVFYAVMDYVEGENLKQSLERGERFSQPQVILWAVQILGALDYLHSPTHGEEKKGFVHSDIKPSNLMRTPDNNVFVIDFNIALALGEEAVIGKSAGYASPEHYGLDYSSGRKKQQTDVTLTDEDKTEVTQTDETEVTLTDKTLTDEEETECEHSESESSSKSENATLSKRDLILPDVRSDIYSTGATLYHLLSGVRPAKDAKEVVPLSEKEFNPQIVKIITKAMIPDPDARYQTAKEMLDAFLHLRENDVRVKRLRRQRRVAAALFVALFAVGALSAFWGLKRMQLTESWLKLAEYSQNALAEGDTEGAVAYALQALPERTWWQPDYTAQAQRALSKALGVYDLADGYKSYETVNFPSAPLSLVIAPDGKTALCVYAWNIAIFDTQTAEILTELPIAESALAEAVYLNEHTIVYAGEDGVTAYDIESQKVLWMGNPATALCVSADKKSVAAIWKEESFATIYDSSNGEVKTVVDFKGKKQRVTVNDSFANPKDNLLALNEDGSLLGVSFADGSLEVYDWQNPDNDLLLFDETSGYWHFEGGFYQDYFAFSATNEEESVFAVIDTVAMEQTGGFESQTAFSVETDENGIYVQTDNLLVEIDPVSGEQRPLVTTAETILHFARSNTHTLISTAEDLQFFDQNAVLTTQESRESVGSTQNEFVQIAEGIALIGNKDEGTVRIMKYENHPEAEFFAYDASYPHDEARVSADRKTVMLFRYDAFRLYDVEEGEILQEVAIPDAEQVYDQQYRREGEKSYLEVIYNDGSIRTYSAEDGSLLSETEREAPDLSLYEEFETESVRVTSPLHGTPAVYDRESERLLGYLDKDAYLTYVTQVENYLIVQYVTTDGYFYGQILDMHCEVLADLPYLSDVIEKNLIFDYPTGNMRETRIYDIYELISMAQK